MHFLKRVKVRYDKYLSDGVCVDIHYVDIIIETLPKMIEKQNMAHNRRSPIYCDCAHSVGLRLHKHFWTITLNLSDRAIR